MGEPLLVSCDNSAMAEATCSDDERRDEQSQATATRDSHPHSNSNSGEQLSPVLLNAIRNARCYAIVEEQDFTAGCSPKQPLSKEETKQEFMDFIDGKVIMEEKKMEVTTPDFLEVLEDISNIILFGVRGKALHNINEKKPTMGIQHEVVKIKEEKCTLGFQHHEVVKIKEGIQHHEVANIKEGTQHHEVVKIKEEKSTVGRQHYEVVKIKKEKSTNGSQQHELDALVHIDSSSEEDIMLGVEFAKRTCGQQFQSKLQQAVKRVTYPSRTDVEAIDILASDLRRLEPSQFLNDTIIDFYVRYIQRELLSKEECDRFYFFNCFFYKKLSILAKNKKTDVHKEYHKILKWTRGINIFEKDYLIIPVHDMLHWSLAIVCFPKCEPGSSSHCERCILHLDSLPHGHESYNVFQLLRRYLVAKWKDMYGGVKRGRDDCTHISTQIIIPGKRVPVPLQENLSDCGLFLLHYASKFVQNAPKTMKLSDVKNVFGEHWFPPSEASNLRAAIQTQLRKLFKENEGL